MAAFFRTPVSGRVVRAEHVFAARSAAPAASRLAARWIRDAEGRLIRTWREDPPPTQATEPLRLSAAA